MLGAVLVLAAVSSAPGQGRDSTPARVQIQPPRDFGYLTGDLLELQASVRVPRGFALDVVEQPDSAWPAWLEVRESSWKAREAADALSYDLRFVFQVFFVADSLTNLEIPGRRLVFRSERTGERLQASVPPFRFNLSPLTDSSSELEPDLPIAPPSMRWIWASVAALAALCAWVILMWSGQRRRSRVFRRAQRDVRRARDCGEAILRLHRALEERAGGSLFAHDLGPLTDRWPAGEEVRDELERFFGMSNAVFYRNGGGASEDCLPWLQGFARRLVSLERRDGGGGRSESARRS